jgi:16S rRNA (guanine966-N2)-methyltransferase
MRIISGEARGRSLSAPRRGTRPTSDLMRGVVFSMLASMGVEPKIVLDLYSGTGAMGIEALSRGASWVDFVEHNRAACKVIHANLNHVGYEMRARVYCSPVLRALSRLERSYDVVFADPPYADAGAVGVLDSPTLSMRLSADSVLVYEHDRRSQPPARLAGLKLLRSRGHGSSEVSFYAGQNPEEST